MKYLIMMGIVLVSFSFADTRGDMIQNVVEKSKVKKQKELIRKTKNKKLSIVQPYVEDKNEEICKREIPYAEMLYKKYNSDYQRVINALNSELGSCIDKNYKKIDSMINDGFKMEVSVQEMCYYPIKNYSNDGNYKGQLSSQSKEFYTTMEQRYRKTKCKIYNKYAQSGEVNINKDLYPIAINYIKSKFSKLGKFGTPGTNPGTTIGNNDSNSNYITLQQARSEYNKVKNILSKVGMTLDRLNKEEKVKEYEELYNRYEDNTLDIYNRYKLNKNPEIENISGSILSIISNFISKYDYKNFK